MQYFVDSSGYVAGEKERREQSTICKRLGKSKSSDISAL